MIPPLAELDGWLAAREAAAGGVRPGCEKRVTWAGTGARGPARAPWAVVYVHGFSASRRELSPFPERVAEGLGANLFGTRLAGHGQDGAAMGRATLGQWRADLAEAFAVGRALGERVLAVSCSMGGTLMALALAGGEEAAGAVLVSPLFGVRMRRLQAVLDAPGVGWWGPLLVRGEQGPPAASHGNGIWTRGYPTAAYLPMAAAVRAVRRADLEAIRTPALFAYAEEDRVVDPGLTAAVMARWGGGATPLRLRPRPGDDPSAHVMAGDALSPGQTDGLVAATLRWAGALSPPTRRPAA